jgi:hypothetical protein
MWITPVMRVKRWIETACNNFFIYIRKPKKSRHHNVFLEAFRAPQPKKKAHSMDKPLFAQALTVKRKGPTFGS